MPTVLAFSKPDRGDNVEVVLVYEIDGETFTRPKIVSDRALQARALARGREAWDEDDLAAEVDAQRTAPPPEPVAPVAPPPVAGPVCDHTPEAAFVEIARTFGITPEELITRAYEHEALLASLAAVPEPLA